MNVNSKSSVKVRPSGENPSHGNPGSRSDPKVSSGPRVAASRIFIVKAFLTAMNLLHGDHVADVQPPLQYEVARTGSHEIDNPRTTLAKGHAYWLYSSRTIDVRGDRGSAEM